MYLVLSGNVTIPNLVVGALIALGVSMLLPARKDAGFDWKRSPAFLWAMVRYVFVVIWDILKGGIATARLVLSPKMPLKTGIIAIPSGSKTELGTALSAHAITLSPGELVVDKDDEGVMYTHCLDVDKSERYVAEAQALRKNLLQDMFE
ncbi:MAG: Na+/H+ antiporter subunit E [Anaerolineales bacterium]